MRYVVGSDKKTVQIAREVIARVDAAMEAGDWQGAERIIEAAMQSSNRPFKAELEHQLLAGQV